MPERKKKVSRSILTAARNFKGSLPILLAVVLLMGLFRVYVPGHLISRVLTGDLFQDTLLGAAIGSISIGNPITSYIIGGELLDQGVSLLAVAAFLLAWVNIGLLQFSMEGAILGYGFAVKRNILSFIFVILVAAATVRTLGLLT